MKEPNQPILWPCALNLEGKRCSRKQFRFVESKSLAVLSSKALFIDSVKNFLRRAYFCFFKQNFELKKFELKIKNFSAHQRSMKRLNLCKIFYAKCKQGLRWGSYTRKVENHLSIFYIYCQRIQYFLFYAFLQCRLFWMLTNIDLIFTFLIIDLQPGIRDSLLLQFQQKGIIFCRSIHAIGKIPIYRPLSILYGNWRSSCQLFLNLKIY